MKRRRYQSQMQPARRPGLSQLEVVVVALLVAILFACSAPGAISLREAARRATCKDHLHQMGIAMHTFHEQNNRFPPGYAYPWDFKAKKPLTPKDSKTPRRDGFSWMAYLLPFMDLPSLAEDLSGWTQPGIFQIAHNGNEVKVCKPLGDGNGPKAKPDAALIVYAGKEIPAYRCPSAESSKTTDWKFGTASYAGNLGWSRVEKNETGYAFFSFDGMSTKMNMVTDGLTYTIAIAEAGVRGDSGKPFASSDQQQPQWAGSPHGNWRAVLREVRHDRLPNTSDDGFTSAHEGGIHVLAGDGAIHFISQKVHPAVWVSLGTRRRLSSNDQSLVKLAADEWRKDFGDSNKIVEVQAQWPAAPKVAIVMPKPKENVMPKPKEKTAEDAEKTAAEKKNNNAGMPPWLWFIAGAGSMLVVMLGVLFVTRRKPSAS